MLKKTSRALSFDCARHILWAQCVSKFFQRRLWSRWQTCFGDGRLSRWSGRRLGRSCIRVPVDHSLAIHHDLYHLLVRLLQLLLFLAGRLLLLRLTSNAASTPACSVSHHSSLLFRCSHAAVMTVRFHAAEYKEDNEKDDEANTACDRVQGPEFCIES